MLKVVVGAVVLAIALASWLLVWAEEPVGAAPLVVMAEALESTRPVQVAGVVDHASQRQVAIDNGSGVAFTLTGADGSATEVVVAGKLPVGFDVASTVVVVGAGRDGRFQATEVLIPGAVAAPDPGRGLTAVMAVTMVVWLGLFGYVFRLHRKLRTLEGA